MSAKAKRGFFSINPEYSKYIHGILLAFIIYIFADAISKFIGIQILGLKKTPISNVMVSIVLGLIISNVYNIGDIFKPGIGYCLKFILRLGIIFFQGDEGGQHPGFSIHRSAAKGGARQIVGAAVRARGVGQER